MFKAKHISPIIALFLLGAILQTAACGKNGNQLRSTNSPGQITDNPDQPGDTTGIFYLALGDSYTIGQSVAVADRYPVQALKEVASPSRLRADMPEIIATTGWTTGDLLAALSSKDTTRQYDIVTLLIGVNNEYQGRTLAEYHDQFATLLQKSILLAGNRPSHVLVLSIPDYSVTPFGRNMIDTAAIAAGIDSFNNVNHALSQAYRVNYLDITAESRKAANDPTLIAVDGLHFSGKEYAIWARLMEPLLRPMIHKPMTQ